MSRGHYSSRQVRRYHGCVWMAGRVVFAAGHAAPAGSGAEAGRRDVCC